MVVLKLGDASVGRCVMIVDGYPPGPEVYRDLVARSNELAAPDEPGYRAPGRLTYTGAAWCDRIDQRLRSSKPIEDGHLVTMFYALAQDVRHAFCQLEAAPVKWPHSPGPCCYDFETTRRHRRTFEQDWRRQRNPEEFGSVVRELRHNEETGHPVYMVNFVCPPPECTAVEGCLRNLVDMTRFEVKPEHSYVDLAAFTDAWRRILSLD